MNTKRAKNINPALLALSFEKTAIDVATNVPKKVKHDEPRILNKFAIAFWEAIAPAHLREGNTWVPHLILLQAALWHGLVSLLLKGDDDQSHKDVDEEEGENHKVDHVEDGRLHAEARIWTLVFVSGVHRVLEDPGRQESAKL